jgi:hypothetical protein
MTKTLTPLEKRRRKFLREAGKRTATFDRLERKYPEFGRARAKRVMLQDNRDQAATVHADCVYCQEGYGRHGHSFMDRDGRISRSNGRLYGRESAIAYVAGMRRIQQAREQAKEARRNVIPPLSERAREAYPELARFGFWPHSTLAEADLRFAADWQLAEMMSQFGSAVKPVVESVVQRIRDASDLDFLLAEARDELHRLADSPREAAELYGLVA